MAVIQGQQQAAIRVDSGTTLHYIGDFLDLMYADLGITEGPYPAVLVSWLQFKLTSTGTNLNGLKAEAAADRGVSRWEEITDPTAIGSVYDIIACRSRIVGRNYSI